MDTSAFVALENRADTHHDTAVAAYRRLLDERTILLTSDYVFDEVVTLVGAHAGAEAALDWGRRLLASTLFELLVVDRELLESALEVLAGAPDRPVSFTDRTSFALMREAGVEVAFAFDDGFRRSGFEIVPGAVRAGRT